MRLEKHIITAAGLCIIFLNLSGLSAAESTDTFYVIHVKGTIFLKATGQELKTGDQIDSETEVAFRSPDAVAAIMSRTKGRFTLRADNLQHQDTESELTGFVKNCFFPSQKMASTRGMAGMTDMLHTEQEFLEYFSHKPYVLLDTFSIKVNPLRFPMHEQAFFYIRYTYQGESINKKLEYKEDIFIFDGDFLYRVDEKPVKQEDVSEMYLYYYSTGSGEKPTSRKMTDIHLIFPDKAHLESEIRILLSHSNLPETPPGKIIEDVMNFLYEFYNGTPIRTNVKAWLEKNFDLG